MRTQTPSTTESTYNSADLAERAIQRRAIEATIWGMPAVNYHLMYQEMVNKIKGASTRSSSGLVSFHFIAVLIGQKPR